MDLLLGDKETTQLYALPSITELNNRFVMSNHQQTLKEVTELVIDGDTHLLVNDLWIES